jgi:hypothetical protein
LTAIRKFSRSHFDNENSFQLHFRLRAPLKERIMGFRKIGFLHSWVMLALASVGCGSGVVPESSDGGTKAGLQLFIASQSDFAGFSTWESFSFDAPGTADGKTHTAGKRIVYLNQPPPHGSTSFPVGTIIVKKIQPGTATAKTFAMVKRGGNYNSHGAPGWEWFELDPNAPDSAPVLLWRGVAPPAGENYSGSQSGTCNDCHGAARNNDSVQSPPLQLPNF